MIFNFLNQTKCISREPKSCRGPHKVVFTEEDKVDRSFQFLYVVGSLKEKRQF